jgi:hypothetical protein
MAVSWIKQFRKEECLMKKLGFAFVICAAGMFAGDLTGVVSDSHCGAKHNTASAEATKCVEGCVKGGAQAVFVSGDKVYKIDSASQDKVKSYYGKQVTVTGDVDGDTLKIESVKES